MQLIFSPNATRAMMAMPKKDAAAMMKRLQAIAEAPFGMHAGVQRMKGGVAFRVRQGDWRAVYRVDRATQQVIVDTVGHRREVYR